MEHGESASLLSKDNSEALHAALPKRKLLIYSTTCILESISLGSSSLNMRPSLDGRAVYEPHDSACGLYQVRMLHYRPHEPRNRLVFKYGIRVNGAEVRRSRDIYAGIERVALTGVRFVYDRKIRILGDCVKAPDPCRL